MGDPAVWPDSVWDADASGERYQQWSESPKYLWLESALDTLLDLRVSQCYYEGKLEDYKSRNDPLPVFHPDDLQNCIADRKKRIERLKQTILTLMGPPSKVYGIPPIPPIAVSGTSTEKSP